MGAISLSETQAAIDYLKSHGFELDAWSNYWHRDGIILERNPIQSARLLRRKMIADSLRGESNGLKPSQN